MGSIPVAGEEKFRRPNMVSIVSGPGSSVGRGSAPGNGKSRPVGSITGRDIPKSLKMVLAAPRSALRLTGQS